MENKANYNVTKSVEHITNYNLTRNIENITNYGVTIIKDGNRKHTPSIETKLKGSVAVG